MHIDDQFDKLAQDCINACGEVTCGVEEYRAGLKHVIAEIQIAPEASRRGEDEVGEDDE